MSFFSNFEYRYFSVIKSRITQTKKITLRSDKSIENYEYKQSSNYHLKCPHWLIIQHINKNPTSNISQLISQNLKTQPINLKLNQTKINQTSRKTSILSISLNFFELIIKRKK